MERRKRVQQRIKVFWFENKDRIISNGVVVATVALVLILTVISGLSQKIIMEQKIQKLARQAAVKHFCACSRDILNPHKAHQHV